MTSCPACSLELPSEALFCARCGIRLPGRTTAPAWWVFALFSVGAFLTFYSAVSMVASFYLDPTLSTDQSKRFAGYLVVAFSSLLWGAQIAAIIGMARSRPWGRLLATVACAGWVLTCVGVPVSILVLRELWRVKRSPLRAGR